MKNNRFQGKTQQQLKSSYIGAFVSMIGAILVIIYELIF